MKHFIVKVHDGDFIARVGSLDHSQRGGFNLFTFVTHAAAVVDDESHRYGNILALERRYGLCGVILDNCEGRPRKIRDKVPLRVDDSRVKDNKSGVSAECWIAFLLSGCSGCSKCE